jgi:4-hydroxy-tetrahydrodipicolinate synthase
MARMVQAAIDGDWTTARSLNAKYFTLMRANFWDSSPGPVKCVLGMMGRITESYRLPMVPVDDATRARLKALAQGLGLLATA